LNTLGGHIAALRIDLKLLQKHLGGQIDVDEAAINSWERNSSASSSLMELSRFTLQ
jgi:DNA-binding XRE family transcriptional regulator